MTRFDRNVGLRLLNLHQLVYERSGGRIGHRLAGRTMLMLRTTGRRTGAVRTAALLYGQQRPGQWIVVGSKGGSDAPPAWLVNLRAHPDVEVQVGTRVFRARAREAAGEERDRLWRFMTGLWPDYDRYQSQTRRRIPIVVLESAG